MVKINKIIHTRCRADEDVMLLSLKIHFCNLKPPFCLEKALYFMFFAGQARRGLAPGGEKQLKCL